MVVENFITINRDICLNYVVSKTGIVTYLGCAEQLVDSHGSYYGNIIDCANQAPATAVSAGYHVVRRGADHGYWGVVGIDMAILADNQILVYDLNFRLNGSTPALLLAESVCARHGSRVICYQTMKGRSSYQGLLDAAYVAMERGILLPLSSCHPEFLQDSSVHPLLGCMVLGQNCEQINEHLQILAELGLESRPV